MDRIYWYLRSNAFVAFFALGISGKAVFVDISITTHDYCANSTGTAHVSTNATAPFTILWSNGATTTNISGLSAGIYWVDVVDALGDTYSDTAEVIGYAQLPLYTDGSVLLTGPVTGYVGLPCAGQCNGAVGMHGPQPGLGPTGPFTYSFDPSITYEGDEPVYGFPVYSGFCDGAATSFTYTDANGCSGTGNVWTDFPGGIVPPLLDVVLTTDYCMNGTGGTVQLSNPYVGVDSVDLYRDGNFVGWFADEELITGLLPGFYTGQYWAAEGGAGSQGPFPYQCGPSPFSFSIYDMGPGCGTLQGNVWYDEDEDCTFDGGENGWAGQVLEIAPAGHYAYVNGNGQYAIQLPAGNYQVSQLGAFVDPICPAVQPVPFTISGATTTVDLASVSNQPMDIVAQMGSGVARPGFDQQVYGHVYNHTPQATGPVTVTCVLDPNVVYVNATPIPTVLGNTLSWDLADLSFFGDAVFHVQVNVPAGVPLGTAITHGFSASNTLPEVTLANNSISTTTIVTGSFDPNDKTARTSSGLSDAQYLIDQDEWIDYTIRFQNTGTDTAFTVVITDTLSTELDMTTFEQGASSHPVQVDFRTGRVVRWTFTNILLPDSNVNESMSHGLTSFRIRPHLPLLPGTTIENTANIYFDFNPPVITEPSVLVAEFSTGVDVALDAQVAISPNPTSDQVRVGMPDGSIHRVRLFSMDGRLIMDEGGRGESVGLDVSELPPGTYLLELTTSRGSSPASIRQLVRSRISKI